MVICSVRRLIFNITKRGDTNKFQIYETVTLVKSDSITQPIYTCPHVLASFPRALLLRVHA
jgi:hypothetical protein